MTDNTIDIDSNDDSVCPRCGGTVAPDGRCWDCGAGRPGYRSHLEIGLTGGAAGVSDRGRHREVNADAMALTTAGPWTVGVVCDGVSMAPRGERAARLAADVGAAALVARLTEGVLPETALAESALRAGRAVTALAASPDPAPACTYAAGIAGPEGVWSTWVGDSRVYWLPDEGPGTALTEDDTGELDVLAAWLGAGAGEPAPRIRSYRPAVPGRLLLCTDGLWRHLPTAGALRAVADRGARSATADGGRPLLGAARALVDHALAAGGRDNITALLLPVAAAVPGRPAAPGPA
ncbi:PP2C family protein-serine/threonine phosphatase [Streptomyces sp. NRRL B-24484]|uniref:PP2C family protein-serine/threonine phosphatase n=1 Tax=Streptomyces sp. NRRL B-24484 TaxID=1463833 RepID=UPI00099834E0|nr:protein phosphatase 2C domain-containing protein [Streptomyces sp. NRRL B-24484]